MLRAFDDDPFFSGHRDRMRDLSGFAGMPMMSIALGNGMVEPSGRRDHGRNAVSNRPQGFGNDIFDMFSQVRQMMNGEMQQMMSLANNGMQLNMSADGGNGHSFVQSSVYSYRNTGEGQPEIYEAHHSNRYGPGGIREERKAVRDTRRHLEKMGVGRHIGDRGHYIERSKNTSTNETQEHQDLYGLSEDQVEGYQREWHEKTRGWSQQGQLDQGHRSSRELGAPRSDRHHRQSVPEARAIEYRPTDAASDSKLRKSKRNSHL